MQSVNQFLTRESFSDFGSSRIGLAVTKKFIDGEQQFIGHTASVEFQLTLQDLDRLEALLIGVVDAGANEITAVDYTTSSLKELRADARKQAVAAAREKAEIYCASAKVKLGNVLHINDMNPEMLRGRESHGRLYEITEPDDESADGSFSPGAIAVGGAVLMAFAIDA